MRPQATGAFAIWPQCFCTTAPNILGSLLRTGSVQLCPATLQPSLPLAGVGSNSAGIRPGGGGCDGAPALPCRISVCKQVTCRTTGDQHLTSRMLLGPRTGVLLCNSRGGQAGVYRCWKGLPFLACRFALGQSAGGPSSSPKKDESEQDSAGQHISKDGAGPGAVPLAPAAGGHQPLTPVMQDTFNGGLQHREEHKAWSGQFRADAVQHTKAGHICADCPEHEGCPAWWAAAQIW